MTEPPTGQKPRTRQRLNPDERRAQLLEHALAAFADAGIERAVHADVAGRANVSTPTVFKYFSTREALVDAVLTEVEQSFERLYKLLPKNVTLPPRQLVMAWAALLSQLCSDRPDLMKVALMWSVSFSPIKYRFSDFEDGILAMLSSSMDPDLADKSDARILFACASHFIKLHFVESTDEKRREYVDRACEIFEHAPASSLR